MRKSVIINMLPNEALEESIIKNRIAQIEGLSANDIRGFNISRRSLDARRKRPHFTLSIEAFINEEWQKRKTRSFHYRNVRSAKHRVVIVGAGPAGLFAALRLIESGIKPIILERGKDVKARRRDLARLNKEGVINPESNYCFGEGGAGTYSDGKLYTRSSKRGDVDRILDLFVQFGADDNILYESHPHIGTNKLPGIVVAMREQILGAGGEILFGKKLVDLIIDKSTLKEVQTADGDLIEAENLILATGHSARDIFHLLSAKGLHIESKPFALGVRVEHPQELINCIQYHCTPQACDPNLPPASYNLVQQLRGVGVFSFCMCPGGIIAPASTSNGELVVNGWSPSKRNNPFANSGIVVQVNDLNFDLHDFGKVMEMPRKILNGPLGMMYFQQYVERKAFAAGGEKFIAPAQRLMDFCDGKTSQSLPTCSYPPGICSFPLKEVLPRTINNYLQDAFRHFGRKFRQSHAQAGYLTNDAVVLATESRTSSPVRIPRDAQQLHHPQLQNLYPCGEGAGYAGGIVSAAMDGEKVAGKIAAKVLSSLPK